MPDLPKPIPGEISAITIQAPIIETERLLLKELNPEIMNELFTTYSDEDIITFLGLRSEDELQVEKNKWQQGLTTYRMSFKRFLIIEKNNGKVIGSCGFHNWYAEHQRAELGYNISNEAKKGEGFMKEALKAVITHGFEKMGLNRIEALISPGNVPSLKLVRGFGFTEEGTLRSHYCVGGKMQDSVCFSLLKPEYRKLKKTWST